MRKVLVVDSGVGGLNVLDKLATLRTDLDYIYFADERYCPYGAKTVEEVAQRTLHICNVFSNVVDAVVLACNTASACMQSVFGDEDILNSVCLYLDGLQVISTLHPTVRKAIDITKNKKVCLLGTKLCVNSGVYSRLFAECGVECTAVDCGEFVTLAEKHCSADVCYDVVCRKLDDNADLLLTADAVVLGCTHFDYVYEQLRTYFRQTDVQFVSSADTTANFAADNIVGHVGGRGRVEYLMSGNFAYVSTFCSLTGRDFKLFDI